MSEPLAELAKRIGGLRDVYRAGHKSTPETDPAADGYMRGFDDACGDILGFIRELDPATRLGEPTLDTERSDSNAEDSDC